MDSPVAKQKMLSQISMMPKVHKNSCKEIDTYLSVLQADYLPELGIYYCAPTLSFDNAVNEESLSNCPEGVTSLNNQSLLCQFLPFSPEAKVFGSQGYFTWLLVKNLLDDEIEGGLYGGIGGFCVYDTFICFTDIVLGVLERLQHLTEEYLYEVSLLKVDMSKHLQIFRWEVDELKIRELMEKMLEDKKGTLAVMRAFKVNLTEYQVLLIRIHYLFEKMLTVDSQKKPRNAKNEKNKLHSQQNISEKINKALPQQVELKAMGLTQAECQEVPAKDYADTISQEEEICHYNIRAKQNEPIRYKYSFCSILKTECKRSKEKTSTIEPRTDLDDIGLTLELKLQTQRIGDAPACRNSLGPQCKQSIRFREQTVRENATPVVHPLGDMKPSHSAIADFRPGRLARHARIQPPTSSHADVTRPREGRDRREEMRSIQFRTASLIHQRETLPFRPVDIAKVGLFYDEDSDKMYCCECSWSMPKKQFCEIKDLTAVHSCLARGDATPPARGEQLHVGEGNGTEHCEVSGEQQATEESRKLEETEEGASASDLLHPGSDFSGLSSKDCPESAYQESLNCDDLVADAAEGSDNSTSAGTDVESEIEY